MEPMEPEPRYSEHVEGEHFKTAEAMKHENLEGPSEAELSEARVAKEHYVPPVDKRREK